MLQSILENRIHLANLPTRIEYLERTSKRYGFNLYVKRDDLTDIVASGNKIRKLEFLFKDAMNKRADTVLTCGGIQSNHCRATAAIATKLGMKSVLILRGEKESLYDGNLLLDKLLGADTVYITPEEYKKIDEVFEVESERLRKRGRKPYVIPEGGSNEIGFLGYVNAAREMKEQIESMDIHPGYVFTAVGSAGTYAGLFLGKKLFDMDYELIGVNVTKDPEEKFVKRVENIIGRFLGNYKFPQVDFDEEEIKIIPGAGIGYAMSTDEELNLIYDVARTEGLILDPVYTVKCFLHMLEYLKEKDIHGEDILFFHTGGIYGIYPNKERLTKIIDER